MVGFSIFYLYIMYCMLVCQYLSLNVRFLVTIHFVSYAL